MRVSWIRFSIYDTPWSNNSHHNTLTSNIIHAKQGGHKKKERGGKGGGKGRGKGGGKGGGKVGG